MGEIVPRSQLTHHGVKAVGAIAGGITLLALASLGGIPGIIVGGVITVVGASLIGSKRDRGAGAIIAAAGAVTALSSLLLPGLDWLIRIPGIGLIGVGIYSLVKFIRGMKTRT